MPRKIAMIGGGGVRTPLLIYGLAQSCAKLDIAELALFDIDLERTGILAGIGREIVRRMGASLRVTTCARLEEACEGAAFVVNSIRVGGIAARARDERIAIEHGLAGQETTGPGGAAMALRTIPVTLAHARVVERVAPDAWFINFTNPAGVITQALCGHTGLRAVGICDTPAELFHQIATALGEPLQDVELDYAGLNHLGWVRAVSVRGADVTARLLDDETALQRLYPARLFDPALIRTLRLIPTEYLFFYYSQRRAHGNQLRAGASRGAEIEKMNAGLFDRLRQQGPQEALATYRDYLVRRNASYLKLEAEGGSAFAAVENAPDPFETATGYHRMALDVMAALLSDEPKTVVVNVPSRGAIGDLNADDVVEVPCRIDRGGAVPRATGRLPESVRGLVQSVKAYERTIIRAALEKSTRLAALALLENPIVGDWELAASLVEALIRSDPEGLGYLA